MKNVSFLPPVSLKLLFTFCAVALFMGMFSCTSTAPKVNKEEALKEASTPDVDFAKAIIAKNSSLGFAEAEKGKKDTLSMIASALTKFNYDSVIEIGNEYISRYGMDNDVRYMLATAMFQQSEYAKAAEHYNALLVETEFEHQQMTKYYLALCYLRFDSPSAKADALKLLNQLKADPGVDFKVSEIQMFIDLIE